MPGEILSELPEGAVAITVPTAFLSTEGGGVFLHPGQSLRRRVPARAGRGAGDRAGDVSLSYVVAKDGKAMRDTVQVGVPASGRAGDGLQLAHTLVDEFLALREGTTKFHAGDEEAAYQIFRGLSQRLEGNPDPRLKPERELAGQLLAQTAFLSGNSDERLRAFAPPRSWASGRSCASMARSTWPKATS